MIKTAGKTAEEIQMKTFNLETFGEELDGIIRGFGNEGRIFSNEEQFQFELAWKLKEAGYNVRLEVLSIPKANEKEAEEVFNQASKQERDKMYTDIVVDISDSESIAIELKYKTLGGEGTGENASKFFDYKTESGTYRVFNQGASNLGCAYYLADVARIERLIDLSERNNEFNGFDLCHPEERRRVVQGYAIIIANDKSYWAHHEEGTDADIFSLSEGDYSKGKGEYKKIAREGKSEKDGTQYPAIELNNQYRFLWNPYYPKKGEKIKNPEFQYLILQIPPKETK